MDKGAIMAASPYEAVEGANLMVLVTEWDEFYNLDFEEIKKLMASFNIIDGRNIFNKEKLQKLGFSYAGIGY
jgi:UDPglucose 6-dehydrogenase